MGAADHIESHEDLVARLRSLAALRDKGKVYPAFYFKSRAFLHFHVGDAGIYADVRFGDEFEPVPATNPVERAALLRRVEEHISTPATPRR